MGFQSDVSKFRESNEFKDMMTASRKNHNIPPHVAEFFSDESLEVLEHFGFEAPMLLNKYACVLEDCLIRKVSEMNQEDWTSPPTPKKMGKRFKKKRKM